jgi:hypothetical protein
MKPCRLKVGLSDSIAPSVGTSSSTAGGGSLASGAGAGAGCASASPPAITTLTIAAMRATSARW